MTTLPEAEIAQARQLADQLVEILLTEDVLNIGTTLLNPDAGDITARDQCKCLFVNDPFSRQIVLNAALNGYMPARVALGELVQEIEETHHPSELKSFMKACSNPRFHWPSAKRGARRRSHVWSDGAFVLVVLTLWRRFPNVPPMSQSGRRVCHCDIAADAFTKRKDRIGRGKITRAHAIKIWQRAKKQNKHNIHKIGDQRFLNIFNKLSSDKLGR
jgi:hypothetical protein